MAEATPDRDEQDEPKEDYGSADSARAKEREREMEESGEETAG